jgi:hypothetical protein
MDFIVYVNAVEIKRKDDVKWQNKDFVPNVVRQWRQTLTFIPIKMERNANYAKHA